MTKKERQEIIIKLISENNVSTQIALKEQLAGLGIKVTQATLSRDINELNLKKETDGGYKYIRSHSLISECPSILKDSVRDIVYAMNTVVLKCHTGMAQAACATLDKMDYMGIVGTIAGDDTIFVLMPNEKSTADFCSEMEKMIL